MHKAVICKKLTGNFLKLLMSRFTFGGKGMAPVSSVSKAALSVSFVCDCFN